MEELVRFIAKSLVDVESLNVSSMEEENLVKIIITADENNVGKIIGKQGKIAKAIRCIAKSAALESGKRVVVEIN